MSKKKIDPNEDFTETPQEKEHNECVSCGFPIHPDEKYCGECLCEDDCGY